jgi:ABC-2 type transport system permease protein
VAGARAATYSTRRWLRRLSVLTVKELRQCSRDLILVGFIAYSFIGAVYIAGTGVTQDLRNATLLVHDADASIDSRDLLYRFQRPYFNRIGHTGSAADGLMRLDSGSAMLLLDIPEDFSETLNRGARPAAVQLLVDTSNVTLGYLASAYGDSIVAQFTADWAQRKAEEKGMDLRKLPSIENASRVWYNPNLNGHWFNAIAQWLTMMTVVAVLLPATALVRERERGTVEQLLVAPLTPMQIMLSKALAMTLVNVVGTVLSVYLIMRPLLAVPFAGSAWLFFATTALYIFSIAGLGLAIATFARSSAEVGMLVILIAVPMTALSGTWTAPEAMPAWARYALQVSPLHHFIECAYGILLRGAGIETLWSSILSMMLLGAALFGIAWLRLRRKLGMATA